jgi:hypothetical protein
MVIVAMAFDEYGRSKRGAGLEVNLRGIFRPSRRSRRSV